jgi:protein-disulfide isomerase
MASRAEQKAAARAAREAQQAQLSAAAARRMRLYWLGGMLAVAVVALVVVIVASSGGGGKNPVHISKSAQASAVSVVNSTLAGIPQSGNVLGNPKAPITITEFGDLVCPICAEFALTSEPQIIASLVKTGEAKLVFRGLETASGRANGGQYVNTQVAARSAGLQGKEWNYILLTYQEQPQTINGTAAEEVPYITTSYLQNLASQIKGLNLVQWQAHMTDKTLANAVAADTAAAQKNPEICGTPTLIVSGPKGSIQYNPPTDLQTCTGNDSAVPTLAQIQSLVSQVG